ncbi:serum amyloid P-component-like [Alosa sapidissima]|uniref:serum amyloid P-component-like n=1 Tax=Alosa sapidissima TaxID=34773 RepID=UPI001C099CA9|nr:serum amyloid P-component-like [Alosa sapidissima]
MMKLAILFLMVSSCYAVPNDMSGKVIIFPAETNTAHVKVTPAVEKIFFSVTVCLRFFSDYNKEQAPFSISTPSHADGFVFFRGDGRYRLYIGDKGVIFNGLPTGLNEWNSVCVTWDSGNGLAQFWVNGKPSAKKALQAGASIAGTPSIMLGQDQDAYAGGFDVHDAFYGHVTDVHMWDNVLSPAEIENYMKCVISRPGNVVDWKNLEYTKHGYVIVEPNQINICP